MKVFAYILILSAVGGGAVFGWFRAGRPDVRTMFRGTGGRTVNGGGEPSPTTTDRDGGTVGPAAHDRSDRTGAGDTGDVVDSGIGAYERAEAHFDALRFGDARREFARAVTRGAEPRPGAARKMEILSDVFERATRKIPRLMDTAPSEVALSNGRVVIGFVTEGVDGSVPLSSV